MIGPRVVFTIALALVGLFSSGAVAAQQAAQVARIGLLTNTSGDSPMLEAFIQGLRDLGYVEGRHIVIERRSSEGNVDRFPALAAELVALKVDVIVAAGTPAALAAKQATRTLPIVFVAVGTPVESGLVTSLARPDGNLTGSSILFAELIGKCLELLKQVVPEVKRIAVLRQPGVTPERSEMKSLKEAGSAARALGVRLQPIVVRGPNDLDKAFAEMTSARAGAVTVFGGPLLFEHRRRLVDLAAKNRLPAIYHAREYVDAGGLMSYGPDFADLFRRAATPVDRILRGAKPSDLPVEQPTKFELVINLRTAKALALTIPQSVLARADHLIER